MPAIKVAFAERQALLAQQGIDQAEVEKEVGQRVLLQKALCRCHPRLQAGLQQCSFRSAMQYAVCGGVGWGGQ